MSLDILFAAEALLPARGGAERHALELLGELAGRGHRVRALWLSGGHGSGAAIRELPRGVEGAEVPAPARRRDAYWRSVHARCGALASAVAAAPRPDVVVTQLHGTPAALAAERPAVVLLPSYESLCKLAFDSVPACPPPRDCAVCPVARSLPEPEYGALLAQRAGQDRVLREAAALIAPSNAVAAAVKAWCGRDATVAAPIASAPVADGAHGGHVLLGAAGWTPHKGSALIEPVVRGLADRDVIVTGAGLDSQLATRIGARVRDEPIAAVLDGAHACVVLSQWREPFCRLAFEAQACGVPVIAPRTGGLPEHVAPRGLLDPASRPADYVAAVRVLDEPQVWAAASAAARRAARAIAAARPLERAADVVERAAAH